MHGCGQSSTHSLTILRIHKGHAHQHMNSTELSGIVTGMLSCRVALRTCQMQTCSPSAHSAASRTCALQGLHGITHKCLSALQTMRQQTSLALLGLHRPLPVTTGSLAGAAISSMTALQALSLTGNIASGGPRSPYQLQPSVLAPLRQLQLLCLMRVELSGRSQGGAELLALLPKLPDLTLKLSGVGGLAGCGAGDYASIIGSGSLQHLWMHQLVVGSGAQRGWRELFPPGKQTTSLTSLQLFSVRTARAEEVANWNFSGFRWYLEFDSNDMLCLVQCCPKLQDLALGSLNQDISLQPLMQLTGLTKLVLPGHAEHLALCGLVGLTTLRHLELGCPQDKDVRALQALTALTYLNFYVGADKEGALYRAGPQLIPGFADGFGIVRFKARSYCIPCIRS